MTESLTEQAVRARVRLAGPGPTIAALPYLLGFHPAESVVVLGLRGTSAELCLTLRDDLVGSHLDEVVAARLAGPLRRAGATRAVAVVVTEHDGDERDGEPDGERDGDLLPRRGLVDRLRVALRGEQVLLVDAVLVRRGRWWSYACRDTRCCPASGHPLEDEADDGLVAAAAVRGRAVLPDRAALEQVVAPTPGSRSEAFDQAGRALATEVGRSGRKAAVRDGVATVLEAVRARSEGPVPLPDGDAARLCVLLGLTAVRDEVLASLDDLDAGASEGLWLDLVRLAEPGWAAAPATLLALQSYLRGDGAFARVCVQRALEAGPDHGLALLLSDALDRGAPPWEVARVVRAVCFARSGVR